MSGQSRAAKIAHARRHLRRCDSVMRETIDQVGPYTLRLEQDRFSMLVRSIISQQISVAAARSIRGRLESLLQPAKLTPEALLEIPTDQLRGVGLSSQKCAYILDLAEKVHGGHLQLRTIGRFSDEAIIDQLTLVKGIGRWTTQMFLIFSLGRLDVFPEDDLGVRVAIRNQYGLDDLPDRRTSREIAAPWRPYASVASWYCWRSLETVATGQAASTSDPT